MDDIVPTQESIEFSITVADIDEVGMITAIELYQGETLIEALTDISLREFTGLLSNNEYKSKVTYTYDLNDGAGVREISLSTGEAVQSTKGLIINENGVVTGYNGIESTVYINEIGIATSAFINNSVVKTIIIGECVEFISRQAFGNSFQGVPNLTSVYFISTNPPTLGYDLFGTTWNSPLFKIYTPIGYGQRIISEMASDIRLETILIVNEEVELLEQMNRDFRFKRKIAFTREISDFNSYGDT